MNPISRPFTISSLLLQIEIRIESGQNPVGGWCSRKISRKRGMVGEWNVERSETKGFCFRLAKRWTGKMGNAATHGTNVVPWSRGCTRIFRDLTYWCSLKCHADTFKDGVVASKHAHSKPEPYNA